MPNRPDAIFAVPRLAEIYDLLEGERDDLGPYLAMAAEFGARRVLDVGCGTGTFACLLAERGLDVTGVDPAAASLDLTEVSGEYVSYRRTYVFAAAGATLTSDSTRRMRTRAELEDSLQAAGYTLAEVRDAPDRPGREWVFLAATPDGRRS